MNRILLYLLILPIALFSQLLEKDQVKEKKVSSLNYLMQNGVTKRFEFYNKQGLIYLALESRQKDLDKRVFYNLSDSSFYNYDSLGNISSIVVKRYEDDFLNIEETYKYSFNEQNRIDSLESFIDEFYRLEVYNYTGNLLKEKEIYYDQQIGDSIIKKPEWKESYHYKSTKDTIREASVHVFKKVDDMYKMDYVQQKTQYIFEHGVLTQIIFWENKDSHKLNRKRSLKFKYSNGLIESMIFTPLKGYSNSKPL